jgi:hypothetical protein
MIASGRAICNLDEIPTMVRELEHQHQPAFDASSARVGLETMTVSGKR